MTQNCRIMAAHKHILCTQGNGPTRRTLFGPVDREQLRMEYQASLRKDLEEASKRWDFDFLRNKPLNSSRFQWERIPASKVPPLYRSCILGRADGGRTASAVSRKRGWAESSHCDKENIPQSQERCSLHKEKLEETPERGQCRGLKRKQTNIKDFFQAKRRVVEKPQKSGE